MARRVRGKPLYLGKNLKSGRPVYLTPASLMMHMLTVGGTGSGKTVMQEGLIRQAIRNRDPVVVIDPKGTLYPRLVRYCYRRNITDRVYLIDPNDDRYRVGVNYFDLGAHSSAMKTELVKQAIYRALGREDSDITITFERWGCAALSLLDEAGLMLSEFHKVLTDGHFRNAALRRSTNAYLHDEWKTYNLAPKAEQAAALRASINRAALFAKDAVITEMIGQPSAIDWQRVFAEGGIVLVNLASAVATPALCRFLGIMLVHQLYHAALVRPERDWTKPAYVVVDEFADVICGDFKDALQKTREFGVGFLLALQNVADLRGVDPDNPEAFLSSVLQNTETKFVMKMRDYEQAVAMAKQIFGPQVSGLEVKHTITTAVPHVEERYVTSVSEGSGATQTTSFAGTELLTPEGLLVNTGTSYATATARQDHGGSTTTPQQWVRYEYQEIPVHWSLEETFHRNGTQLEKQRAGQGYLQYDTNHAAVQVQTELPERLGADPEALLDYTAAICERMHALPPPEARLLIEQRQDALLEEARYRREKSTLLPEHRVPAEESNPSEPR